MTSTFALFCRFSFLFYVSFIITFNIAEAHDFSPELTTIIIGEPGMGKSTLVYNLAGRPSGCKIDGTDAKGVTKTFETFPADLRGEGFKDGVLDTPGLGDQEVKLTKWLALAEKSFQTVHAIIICVSETNPRITMGAELVSLMLERGFLSNARADDPNYKSLMKNKIILVGTKGNLATKKLRRAMPGVAELFAKKAGLEDVGVTYIPVDTGDWEEKDDDEETPVLDLRKLRAHMRKLQQEISKGASMGLRTSYKVIDSKELIGWANHLLGLELSDEQIRELAKELGFWRNACKVVFHVVIGDYDHAMQNAHRMLEAFRTDLSDFWSALSSGAFLLEVAYHI